MKLIIDANVFISALMKDGFTREIIVNSGFNIYFPEFEFQEIYKYKDEILRRSGYSEKEFIRLTTLLLNQMRIVSHEEIGSKHEEACNIMNNIDHDDVIYIATALAFDATIWSDDSHLKMQNKIKVYNTREIKDFYS